MDKVIWDTLTSEQQDTEAERILRQMLCDAMSGVDIAADDYVVPDEIVTRC